MGSKRKGGSKRQKTSASMEARAKAGNMNQAGKRGNLNLIVALCVGLCVFAILALSTRKTPDKNTSAETSNEIKNGAEIVNTADGAYNAVITVEDYGVIEVALDHDAAPETVDNFITLANAGFYDGLTFHRIMEGFMIQGGDPDGNGTGGSGKTIKGEFAANGFMNPISHVRGVISMARGAYDYNSASSQFFIVQKDSEFLDNNYAAFGYVLSGMEVVDEIAAKAKPIDDNGTIPAEEQPVIESIKIIERDLSESGM